MSPIGLIKLAIITLALNNNQKKKVIFIVFF